jgi:LruC domain-containing protein
LIEPFTHPATPYEIKITVDFKDGASLMLMEDFVANLNPFIIVNKRELEVHLPDLQPTSLADLSLFGMHDDASNLPTMSYKTANGLPWAVYTPVSFSYPLEDLEITKAYTQFKPWAESGGSVNPNWYLYPESGKVK